MDVNTDFISNIPSQETWILLSIIKLWDEDTKLEQGFLVLDVGNKLSVIDDARNVWISHGETLSGQGTINVSSH